MSGVTYTWLYTCFCFLFLFSGESCTGIVRCSNSLTSEQLHDSVNKANAENLTTLRKGIWRFQLHCRDCDFSYQECNINNYVCVRLWKRSSAVLTGSVGCWRFVQSPWKLLDPKKFEKKEELHITMRFSNTLPTLQHIANTPNKNSKIEHSLHSIIIIATIIFCVWTRVWYRFCNHWKAWLFLGFATERPWLSPGGPLHSSFAEVGVNEQSYGLLGPPLLPMKLFFFSLYGLWLAETPHELFNESVS